MMSEVWKPEVKDEREKKQKKRLVKKRKQRMENPRCEYK